MERISDIRNRLDYLQGVSNRCTKLRLPTGLLSLVGLSSTAVSSSLFATPYAGDTLGTITAACATISVFCIGSYILTSKLAKEAEDEIFEIEDKYYLELEKESFMNRITSYTK